MIQVFMTQRGTGKSKHMISHANEAAAESKGSIVFIDDDMRPMHELDRKVRFISAQNYEIDSFCSLYGFICGILAQDYDVDSIYIDGIMAKMKNNSDDAEDWFKKLADLSDEEKVTLYFAMNDGEDVPEYLKKYKADIEEMVQ